MSKLKYNNKYVDESYSPIIEKALFSDSVLVPGLTYTNKWKEVAGRIYIHAEKAGTVNAGAPGRKFVGEVGETSLLEITADQNFQKEREIYDVILNSVKYDEAASAYDLTTKEIREGREKVALAKMAMGANVYQDGVAITDENVKEIFLKMRKDIRKKKARADFAIVSPEVYTSILSDTKNYVPNKNDEIVATGIIGRYYGIPIMEANVLDGVVSFNGNSKGFDLSSVDIIMGQNDGFAIFDNLIGSRLKEANDFFGLRAQVEINSGFTVVNKDKLLVKYNGFEAIESIVTLDDNTEITSESPYVLSVPVDTTTTEINFTLNKDAELVGTPQAQILHEGSWVDYGAITIEDGNILKVTPSGTNGQAGSTPVEREFRIQADSISSIGSDFKNVEKKAILKVVAAE